MVLSAIVDKKLNTAVFIQINKLMTTAPYLLQTNSYLIVPPSILNTFAVQLELLAAFHIRLS